MRVREQEVYVGISVWELEDSQSLWLPVLSAGGSFTSTGTFLSEISINESLKICLVQQDTFFTTLGNFKRFFFVLFCLRWNSFHKAGAAVFTRAVTGQGENGTWCLFLSAIQPNLFPDFQQGWKCRCLLAKINKNLFETCPKARTGKLSYIHTLHSPVEN